jgi:AraC-like DNA-binding protein
MVFRRYKPAPPLSDFIENLWLYEGYASPHAKERIFPSGTFELVFNLHDNELRIFKPEEPDKCNRFSGALVSGPYEESFLTDTPEEASVMGVHFKPAGAAAFLGCSAQNFNDLHVDLEQVWGAVSREIHERLCASRSHAERFRLLEKLLRDRLQRTPTRNCAVATALNTFHLIGKRIRTRQLAREAGLSEKRFIDVFKAEVGMTPKMFDRILRFHRVIVAVRNNDTPDWTKIATDFGYFDQSHLIRDFRAFSGFSPENYAARLRKLRMLGSHVKFNHLPLAE